MKKGELELVTVAGVLEGAEEADPQLSRQQA